MDYPLSKSCVGRAAGGSLLSKLLKRKVLLLALIFTVSLVGCSSPSREGGHGDALESPRSSTQEAVDLTRGLGGWGPTRATFTMEKPAKYPTLNSITGSNYGDTRNFLRVKEKDAPNGKFTDRLDAVPGKTYTAMIYYENSASPSTAERAENVNVRVQAPATFTGAGEITALISADNTRPKEVWDGAVIQLPDPETAVALRYVPGTTLVHSRGEVDGELLPDSLFVRGAKLGCKSFDGVLDGTGECAGYVTFDFVLAQPNFTVTTLASSSTAAALAPSAEARLGDIVTIRTQYKNTGTTIQNDVVLRFRDLPRGMQLVDSSVLLANSASGGGYKPLSAESGARLAARGLNVGNYPPGGACYVKFSVRIADVPGHDFAQDGQVYRYPSLAAETNNGTKESGAKILVYGPQQ